MNALIVEDDEIASDVVANALVQLGHCVDVARNGREALEKLRRDPACLVITDWEMPEMSGIELCRAIRREDFTGYIYIIMLTGREGEEQSLEGMYAGADDFLRKPLKPSELLVCLKTAERILSLETRDLAMFAMAKLAESRDPETGAHLERVQNYARVLAQQLSTLPEFTDAIDGEFVRLIYQTSPLHDIGKVGIPDRILLKPGKLDVHEYGVMKTHTNIGAGTLEAALERFPNAKFLHMARDIAAAHHEKFDGKGYPRGLAGDRIPLCARIVALADVYDALTSRRIYKEPISHEQAKATIFAESGSHFDPAIVNAFLASEQQFIAIKQKLGEVQNDRDIKVASPVPAIMALSPFKVLVVEDHGGDLEFLKDFLATAGHQILTAADGAEALRIFIEQAPRAVVADCTMPRMDGFELCRRIRATESGKYVHFIMVTTDSEKAKVTEAFAAGVDDFIARPFDRSEVLGRMRAGLRAAWLHDELARKNAETSEIIAQVVQLNESIQSAASADEFTGRPTRRPPMARLR